MAILQTAPSAGWAKAEWLHWLFVQDERAISCSLDVHADGTCAVTLVPVWAPEERIREMFLSTAEAVQWHQHMTLRLHAGGWRLVEAGVVTHAA
jgi:hypothetical protein